MNVDKAVMQVDHWKARGLYLEYREIMKSGRGSQEDEDIRRAYREISIGRKVIDINLAITNAGCNAEGWPKLAIARAQWSFVHAHWSSNSGPVWFFGHAPESWKQRQYMQRHNVGVRMTRTGTWTMGDVDAKAQVPLIPPIHRPPGALTGYHLLFEAVWVRQPPVDPILMRHVGGPFYVVLAQWDLTPVEQAALRQRLQ